MKFLSRKKEFFKTVSIALAMMFSLTLFSAYAQESTVLTISEIEKLQDQDMEYMKQIHKIVKDYPAFSFTYTMNDGVLEDVTVTGVENIIDRKRLEVVLFDLQSNKRIC